MSGVDCADLGSSARDAANDGSEREFEDDSWFPNCRENDAGGTWAYEWSMWGTLVGVRRGVEDGMILERAIP